MIVRFALKCNTCERLHVARIGMGQEASQTHKFACADCGEQIVIRMDLDYGEVRFEVTCVENCSPAQEVNGAAIVNLEANFLIPTSQQGKDMTFPRLSQTLAMLKKAEEGGSLMNIAAVPPHLGNTRPYRRPDYAEEWKLLKRAWSLTRNNKLKLARKLADAASLNYYANEPLSNVQDWLWRWALFSSQPGFEQLFTKVMTALQPLRGSNAVFQFREEYNRLSPTRGNRYFAIISEFYQSYAEFAQVYFSVTKDMPLFRDAQATSTDFDSVKMFYGNAYEHFSELVELLALLNNMLAGRDYDSFQTLTLEQYRKLDKPGRFRPFALNAPFAGLCAEADNQIRNASHHGSFVFTPSDQIIRYRSGKGGQGPEQEMRYVTYLERCVRLFLQIITLLRVELLIAEQLALRFPL